MVFGHLLGSAVITPFFFFQKNKCTKFDPNQSDGSWEIWALHENGTHFS